ncbi:MAG TPA: amidohydrolase [Treponema sp.]|nr:amidohydrolase [Treponema sp.]
MTDEELLSEVRADHQYVVDLRRHFHMNPEIAKEEFGTAEKIEAELDAIGVQHRRVGETGVYAEIRGTGASPAGGARTIVLRADIDALPIQEAHDCPYASRVPGRMHACGHDAHTAALLGAARILSAHRAEFPGTVRLTFQQGEEIGYGARVFVADGALDGADRSFGLHAASDVPVGSVAITPGPNNASVDWFRISVGGHPAHVSTPQLGVDAVYIASSIVVALQALVTRRTSPMEHVLIGVGKITAGDAYNIVAQHAALEGTVRVFTPEIRAQVRCEMDALAAHIAASYGGTASIEWQDFTSPLINDAQSAAEARRTALRLFGGDKVISDRRPSLGGDDFAEYILKVPGVYAYVGTRNASREETGVAHHDSRFDIDEDALLVAVALYARYAMDFLGGGQ